MGELPLYRDKKWLEKRYTKDRLTISEIADICGVAFSTISTWKIKFSIPTLGGGNGYSRKTELYHDEKWLRKQLIKYDNDKNIIITQFAANLTDLCFYSALVISGGGTIVRESSLLSVPSIEFFPGETAPQEHFLMENGFPIEHIKDPKEIIERSIDIINNQDYSKRFNLDFKKKIKLFENPNEICFNLEGLNES